MSSGESALSAPYLQLVAACGGLLVGAIIAYVSPRLVAYRLPEAPHFPSWQTLIPLAVALPRFRRSRGALLVQLLTAVIFVGLLFRYGSTGKLLLAAVYVSILVAIAYIDLGYRLVLNRLSYPGVALALAASLLWPGIGIKSAVLGAVGGLLLFVVLQILGRGALGTGDTKLALLIGAMRGFPGVFNALLLGVILGGFGAAFALFVLKRGRKEYIAYAPYLAAGAIVSFFTSSP